MKLDYLGWSGHGNLGDDACLEAIKRLAAPVEIEQTADPVGGTCILGGGTLIYGNPWLESATRALRRGAELVLLGTGVDLSVPLPQWETERRAAWGRVIAAAGVVGVRGPESLEAVRVLGADNARVIGDPALSLGTPRDPRSEDHRRDLVLLSAGSDYVPNGGRQRIVEVLGETIRWLHGNGMRVEYLSLRPNDLTHGKRLIERFRLPIAACELADMVQRIRRAHLVVSLRLHGAVFAAANGVPFVSLGYRPKCRDFARSVDGDCLPTAVLNFGNLREAIERIDADYDAIATRLNARADAYRKLQQQTVAAVTKMPAVGS